MSSDSMELGQAHWRSAATWLRLFLISALVLTVTVASILLPAALVERYLDLSGSSETVVTVVLIVTVATINALGLSAVASGPDLATNLFSPHVFEREMAANPWLMCVWLLAFTVAALFSVLALRNVLELTLDLTGVVVIVPFAMGFKCYFVLIVGLHGYRTGPRSPDSGETAAT